MLIHVSLHPVALKGVVPQLSSDYARSRSKRQRHDPPRLLRTRRERPRRRATEQRDELAAFHCPVPPVLPKGIAHRRRPHCGILSRSMSQMGLGRIQGYGRHR